MFQPFSRLPSCGGLEILPQVRHAFAVRTYVPTLVRLMIGREHYPDGPLLGAACMFALADLSKQGLVCLEVIFQPQQHLLEVVGRTVCCKGRVAVAATLNRNQLHRHLMLR